MPNVLKTAILSSTLSLGNKSAPCFISLKRTNTLFSLPLSQEAAAQLEHMQEYLENSNFSETDIDVWSYTWGTTKFSSKKTYTKLQDQSEASPLFTWLWGSSNLGKHKFFFWLLLWDRLSTHNLLRRKRMFLEDYSCVLCNSGMEETLLHLFFECPFSTTCWQSISIHWGLNLQPLDMVITARKQFGSNIFREILITACWTIWLVRNGIIFDNQQPSISNWKRRFKEELGLVCTKAKPARQQALNLWRDNLF